MKVNKEDLVTFLKSVRRNIAKEEEEDNQVSYLLDDATVIFTTGDESENFYGLALNLLGEVFFVLNDLEVTVNDENNDTFIVEDPSVIEFINSFLKIRKNLLESIKA